MQSNNTVISFLRFPMAALVILLHANIVYTSEIPIRWNGGIANFIIILCTNGICQIAVPTFALISGYLFFYSLQSFQNRVWLSKIKRRIQSLFVPYILWNCIAFFWMVAYSYLLHKIKGTLFDIHNLYTEVGGVRMFWDGWCNLPVDGPLWYIRDLMLVILLSPLLYALIKYFKIMGILFLGTLYVFNIWHNGNWLNIQVIFFFALGAYYQMKDLSIFEDLFTIRYKTIIHIITVIVLIISVFTFNVNTKYYQLSHHIFTIFGVASVFLISSKIISSRKIKEYSIAMGGSSFFVYAAHRFAIIDITKDIILKVLSTESQLALLIAYFSVAIITFAICHGCYITMKHLFPRSLSILIGGR